MDDVQTDGQTEKVQLHYSICTIEYSAPCVVWTKYSHRTRNDRSRRRGMESIFRTTANESS